MSVIPTRKFGELDHSACRCRAHRWNCTEMKSLWGCREQLWSCQACSEVISGSSGRMALEQTQLFSSCSALQCCCTFQVLPAECGTGRNYIHTSMAVTMQKKIFSLWFKLCPTVHLKCCLASLSGRIVQSSPLPWRIDQRWAGTGMDPSSNTEFLNSSIQQEPSVWACIS